MCEFAYQIGKCPLKIAHVRSKGVWCHDYAQQAVCGNTVAENGVNKQFMHRRAQNNKSQHPQEASLVTTGQVGSGGYAADKK